MIFPGYSLLARRLIPGQPALEVEFPGYRYSQVGLAS